MEGCWWSWATQEFGAVNKKKQESTLKFCLVLIHSMTDTVNQVPIVLGTLPWCAHTWSFLEQTCQKYYHHFVLNINGGSESEGTCLRPHSQRRIRSWSHFRDLELPMCHPACGDTLPLFWSLPGPHWNGCLWLPLRRGRPSKVVCPSHCAGILDTYSDRTSQLLLGHLPPAWPGCPSRYTVLMTLYGFSLPGLIQSFDAIPKHPSWQPQDWPHIWRHPSCSCYPNFFFR